MKISIAERRPDGAVVTILIEPFGGTNAKTHSVKCERTGSKGTISRFFLDSEQEVWLFLNDYSRFRIESLDTDISKHELKLDNIWALNNLNEVLA